MSHCGCDFQSKCWQHAAEDEAASARYEQAQHSSDVNHRQAVLDAFARLEPYILHEISCDANDLDPLDKTPCTCGLEAARKSMQQLIR